MTAPNSAQKRKPTVLDDSDNEDEMHRNENGGKKTKNEASKSKKRRVIYSSDEDEPTEIKETKATVSSKVAKLKAVDVSNAFGNGPVKRTEKEKKTKQRKSVDVFEADTDDMELMNIDEELLSPKLTKQDTKNKDIKKEIKSPVKEKIPLKAKNTKSPEKIKQEKKSPELIKVEKKSPAKKDKRSHNESIEEKKNRKKNSIDDDDVDDDNNQSSKKWKPATPASNKKPKKTHDESELDQSVYDDDQEKFERRRAAAALYKQMQKRAGPAAPGSKEIPKGEPNCLSGLKFVLTGVFESMEREEAAAVIKDLGGGVTTAISGKTNYVVSGLESGPAKLAKAEDLGIPIISEDDLLDLIREKSGQPTLNKKVKEETKSPKKEEKKSTKTDSPRKIKTAEGKTIFQMLFIVFFSLTVCLFYLHRSTEIHTEANNRQRYPATMGTPFFQKTTFFITEQLPFIFLSFYQIFLLYSLYCPNQVEKYKPKSIKDIIGQQGPASNCNK